LLLRRRLSLLPLSRGTASGKSLAAAYVAEKRQVYAVCMAAFQEMSRAVLEKIVTDVLRKVAGELANPGRWGNTYDAEPALINAAREVWLIDPRMCDEVDKHMKLLKAIPQIAESEPDKSPAEEIDRLQDDLFKLMRDDLDKRD
jgi:uncharacterized Zn finger protein